MHVIHARPAKKYIILVHERTCTNTGCQCTKKFRSKMAEQKLLKVETSKQNAESSIGGKI